MSELRGEPISGVVLEAVDGSAAAVDSDDDGRVELCFEQAGGLVHATKAGYLDRYEWIYAYTAQEVVAGGAASPFEMLSEQGADELYAEVGLERDPARATAIVTVRGYPGDVPLSGYGVGLTGFGAPVALESSGTFVSAPDSTRAPAASSCSSTSPSSPTSS